MNLLTPVVKNPGSSSTESNLQTYTLFQSPDFFCYESLLSCVVMFLVLVQVSLVGLVCDKDISKVTEVRFALDDGTGRIDCKRW